MGNELNLSEIFKEIDENPKAEIRTPFGVIKKSKGEIVIEGEFSPNSWEVSEALKKLGATDSKNVAQTKLRSAWAELESFYEQSNLLGAINDGSLEKTSSTPVEAFISYVQLGIYPPPELVSVVTIAFEEYFKSAGSRDLEDIFFGKCTQGIGNYSAKTHNNEFCKQMLYREKWPENLGKDKKQLAEELIDEFKLEKDLDTFLKSYYRYKTRFTSEELENVPVAKPLYIE